MSKKLQVHKESASLYTRTDIRLDADIYRPQSEEKFPVLLMRQPYGRAIASTVVYAHPRWYASQGYIVVIQDVRGRGTSQGNFDLFAHEIADGEETITWASQLPGSTGEVGMYGFSYQGMTQLYAAATKPQALKTLCPAMIGYDLYTDWAYEGGAFCLQTNLGWAIQLATETARLNGDESSYLKLYTASGNLPLYDSIPARPDLLQTLAPDSFYHAWLDHPHPDSYWETLSPKRFVPDLDLPMLHIGGWFDPYLRGTLNLYKATVSHSSSPQHLIIGPWAHLPWGRRVGAMDYGKEAESPIDRLQIRWFDYFLKGKETGILEQPSVCLFEMGTNQWRCFDSFPSQNQQDYFLVSNGLASVREDAGKLVPQLPEDSPVAEDILVRDPWRPVPALGGHAAIPAGSFDRASIDCRTDVLTYTTEPLEKDLCLAGEGFVEVYCLADTASFDLSAILSQVQPNGKVYNFAQGYVRVEAKSNPVRIALQATCIKIPQGHCLRLSLSADCFPAYPVNPGTGTLPAQAKLIDAQILTIAVNCGKNSPSRVQLPVLEKRSP